MNIRVDLNYPINDGTEVVFRSPVDCSQVTGLIVYYNENGNTSSQEFVFADAHGNNVGDIDHLFAENVVVKVILDLETNMAFVQNADTNAYLEGRFAECLTHTEQSLTPEQQAQARENIGAADKADVESLDSVLLERINPCVMDMDTEFSKGYLDYSTGDFVATAHLERHNTSDYIEFEPGVVYQCDIEFIMESGETQTYPAIGYYNSDESFSRWASMPSGADNLYLENDEKYIRMYYSGVQLNLLRVYPKSEGYEPKVALNPNLKIPQLDELPIGTPEDSLSDTLLERINPCVMDMNTEFAQGYLEYSTGNFIATSGANVQRASDFVKLDKYVVYQCDIEFVNTSGNVQTYATIGYYNSDKSFSRWASMPDEITRIRLKNDETYIRLNYGSERLDLFRMYPKHEGYEPKVVLNSNLEVPQVEKLSMIPYVHARRPVIAFVFDGEYDRNATMEAIFSSHNMRVGFAPQYNTEFVNNSAATYLEWQNKGHEILAHGYYILNGDTYTEEQGKQYIKESYERLTSYGFDIHGFIGSSGKVDEKYLPTLKRYYDYAATENNHQYDGSVTESCLYFGTDSPYNLWRYSIQQSPLESAIAAVDRAMETGGLVLFMGHAKSAEVNYLTDENVEALLTYIEQVGATVKTPYEAIKDYYAIRYDDIVG